MTIYIVEVLDEYEVDAKSPEDAVRLLRENFKNGKNYDVTSKLVTVEPPYVMESFIRDDNVTEIGTFRKAN